MTAGGILSLLGILLALIGLAAGIILFIRTAGRRERVTNNPAGPSDRTLWTLLVVGLVGGLFLLAVFPRFFV